MNVLVSLYRGYGLGDSVQMSAVLRHLVAARPNWKIDYRNEHNVGRGIVENVLDYNQPLPDKRYDVECQICLYDNFPNWYDRPNTRVATCLHDRFGLPWQEKHSRYVVNPSRLAHDWAEKNVPDNAIAFHYRGDSDKTRKDLTYEQAEGVCEYIKKIGAVPYILGRHIPRGWDAEVVCAIISRCRAFVGIDSGPSKCASATNTPALVTWTGHHPAPFHDPAPNTTHLVPVGYHGLEPVCNDKGVIDWFEEHHRVRMYQDNPVSEVNRWLKELLG